MREIACGHIFQLSNRSRKRLEQHMAQRQPGQHDNPCRDQRRDHDQQHYVVFTRLHRLHFCISARFAPFLKRLHVVIKLTRHRDQLVFQQIVIGIRALLIQGRNHRRDPFRVVSSQACRDFIQQLLALRIRDSTVNHRF
ncbi:hypothetical protein D3C80_1436770 [compost metagenome]